MKRKNQVRKYYFDRPSVFDAVNGHRYAAESDFLAKLFRGRPGITRVLEVACGTGGHAALLSAQGFSVTGIDLNSNMVEFAREQHPGLDFRVGDKRDL